MAKYIEMPKLSDTMTEGTLLKWRKKEGDTVETGDAIAEVETDKATMEIEAFDDGVLHKQMVTEGAKVPVGGRVALLLDAGEEPPADGEIAAKESSSKSQDAKKEPSPTTADAPGSETKTNGGAPGYGSPGISGGGKSASASKSGGRVKASPLAKKIAAGKGVELSEISGTGPGGRIVARDVESATPGVSAGGPSAVASVPAIPSTPAGKGISGSRSRACGASSPNDCVASKTPASPLLSPHRS